MYQAASGGFTVACMTYWSRFINWIRLAGTSRYHAHYVQKAREVRRRVIAMADSGAGDGQILTYLRKIHPTTFEELILESFERRGYFVRRNTRYTGDGGVDGQVRLPESGAAIVQCKRYGATTNPRHVADFTNLCMRRNCHGLFVHTGRTGERSRELKGRPVTIVSGSRLVGLVVGRAISWAR